MINLTIAAVGTNQHGETLVDDESILIRRAQRGDVAAFNQLIPRYERLAYSLAYRMLGDPDQAADVTQDAFISAYRALIRFRGDSLRVWLLRIVANACHDVLRARRRRGETSLDALLDDPQSPVEIEDPLASVESEILRRELLSQVHQALQTLPPEQRLAVVLSDVHGLPYDEVARITGSQLGTVKSRISRGRVRLRDALLRAVGNVASSPRAGFAEPATTGSGSERIH